MLQLAGGNDGLNTVVPYANDFYRKARPRIGLKPLLPSRYRHVSSARCVSSWSKTMA